MVLGAGVIGVTSAWYLTQAGHEVTVLDRQAEAGMETSFANGGQVSAGHAEPWARPAVIPKLLRWLGREDAPLLFRPRADWAQWMWGLRFLLECLPGRFTPDRTSPGPFRPRSGVGPLLRPQASVAWSVRAFRPHSYLAPCPATAEQSPAVAQAVRGPLQPAGLRSSDRCQRGPWGECGHDGRFYHATGPSPGTTLSERIGVL